MNARPAFRGTRTQIRNLLTIPAFILHMMSTADAVMPDGSFKELTLAQYKGKFLILVMYPRT